MFSFFSHRSWFSIFSSVHCNFHGFFLKIPSFFLLNAIIKLHEDFGKTGRHNGFASFFNISWPMYVVYIFFFFPWIRLNKHEKQWVYTYFWISFTKNITKHTHYTNFMLKNGTFFKYCQVFCRLFSSIILYNNFHPNQIIWILCVCILCIIFIYWNKVCWSLAAPLNLSQWIFYTDIDSSSDPDKFTNQRHLWL